MFGRMLRNDVRRNTVLTFAVAALMAVSVALATASAGLIAQLGGAADALLDQARAPHLVQMHAGDVDKHSIDRFAHDNPNVTDHQVVELLTLNSSDLVFAGVDQRDNVQQNSLVVPPKSGDLLLNEDNQPIDAVEPGTVIMPIMYKIEGSLQVGDVVEIGTGPGARTLSVVGFTRDSIMNPPIAGSKRIAVNDADSMDIARNYGTREYLIEFWVQDPDTQIPTVSTAYMDAGLPTNGPTVDRATFRMFIAVGEGFSAGAIILASLLLLIVGLLVLRLSFLTTLRHDVKEIGVLSAIGVPTSRIRRLYLVKYAALAAVAALVGLALGLGLLPLMTKRLSAYQGVQHGAAGVAGAMCGALLMFVLTVLFVLVMLRRVGRTSAVEALRAGGTQEVGRGPRLRLATAKRTPTNIRLGFIALLRGLSAHVLLFCVLVISTFIVIVPTAAANTANDPRFSTYMGIAQADVYMGWRAESLVDADIAHDIDVTLHHSDTVAQHVLTRTSRHEVLAASGERISMNIVSSDHDTMPTAYVEGHAPRTPNEIALPLMSLSATGYEVGEKIPVDVQGELKPLTIVGSYQDITNGGKTAKALLDPEPEDVTWYTVLVDLQPGVAPEDVLEEWSHRWPKANPVALETIAEQTFGPVARSLRTVALIILATAALLAALITLMFVRMLIATDSTPIAIQRALGNTDDGIRAQYLTRTLSVLACAVPVGMVLALIAGEGVFNLGMELIFGGMEAAGQGSSQIQLMVNPWLVYGLVPLVLSLSVAAATWLGSRSISRTHITEVTAQ